MRILLLDIEGTIVTREGVIPGAVEAVAELRRSCAGIRFLTNTDSRDDGDLRDDLLRHGFAVNSDEVFSPVTAAATLLSPVDQARAFVLGPAAVKRQLARHVTLTESPHDATHVVVGDCRDSLSYPLLNRAFAALSSGATLLALQRGRYFLAGGTRQLDTGAIVAALEYSAGVQARTLGKPSVDFARLALASVPDHAVADEVWVVGDDATTDIAMGQALGAVTVQVATGKGGLADGPAGGAGPTHRVASIAELPALLGGGSA